MGQYWKCLLERNGVQTSYDHEVDGRSVGAKLMEHSWWRNPFVNTICRKIHFEPAKVWWVGDYADDVDFEYYDKVWKETSNDEELTEEQVSLFDKYLVNHTTNEYLDCNEYFDRSVEKEGAFYDCIHPLPLLTAVGNDQGGGDYHEGGYDYDKVGMWAGDLISVENEEPKGFDKVEVTFIEN